MNSKVFKSIVERVKEMYELSQDELVNSRSRYSSDARQTIFYLCKRKGLRVCDIKTMLLQYAGIDMAHTTIIHGINKVAKSSHQKEFRSFLDDVINSVTI